MNTPKQPELNNKRKTLSLSTNAALLDELKISSFLHLQFDDELNERQIDEVKKKLRNVVIIFQNLHNFDPIIYHKS